MAMIISHTRRTKSIQRLLCSAGSDVWFVWFVWFVDSDMILAVLIVSKKSERG